MPLHQSGKISQVFLIAMILLCTLLMGIWIWQSDQSHTTEEHEQHTEQQDEHDRHEKDEIALSAQQMRDHGLQVAQVSFGEVDDFLVLPGKLVVNTDQQAHVSPNFSGHVEQVAVALGQSVVRGQILAVLSVPELIDQQANLRMAQSSLQLAQQEYQREQQLWTQGISAKQELQRAENAYRQAQISVQSQQARLNALGAAGNNGRFAIRAPISGVISQKDIVVGENVQLADQLFVIENLKDLWLEFNVPNTSNLQLKVGQEFSFKPNGVNQDYSARVQTLNTQADVQTGRLQVRAKVTTQAEVLRPNMLVNVWLKDAKAQDALRIAKNAVQQIEGKTTVFVANTEENGKVHLQPKQIEVGRSSQDGAWLEVISGLSEGESYISDGSFLLKSELEKDEAGHEH